MSVFSSLHYACFARWEIISHHTRWRWCRWWCWWRSSSSLLVAYEITLHRFMGHGREMKQITSTYRSNEMKNLFQRKKNLHFKRISVQKMPSHYQLNFLLLTIKNEVSGSIDWCRMAAVRLLLRRYSVRRKAFDMMIIVCFLFVEKIRMSKSQICFIVLRPRGIVEFVFVSNSQNIYSRWFLF